MVRQGAIPRARHRSRPPLPSRAQGKPLRSPRAHKSKQQVSGELFCITEWCYTSPPGLVNAFSHERLHSAGGPTLVVNSPCLRIFADHLYAAGLLPY